MSHISSIGAGLYTDLSIAVPLTNLSAANIATIEGASTIATLAPWFAAEIKPVGGEKADTTKTFVRVDNIREFPPLGTPPNVVNVPRYGSKTSSQIQGQSDAPSMELTLNFVPSVWAKGTGQILGNMVGDGIQYLFRVSLLNSEPDGYETATDGLGTVQNSQYFFIGKLEALQVSPQLTDANTATITITVQSEFIGAFTSDAA